MASLRYYAATYGQGSYGSSAYNGSTATSTTDTSGGGSLLTNTGFDIAVAVTLACVILLTAIAVRVWKRPEKASR